MAAQTPMKLNSKQSPDEKSQDQHIETNITSTVIGVGRKY